MARVLLTRPLPFPALDALAARHTVTTLPGPLPPTPDALRAALTATDPEALLCLLTDRIDAAALDAAPSLRTIATFAVGCDNIDLHACAARGITVGNTPDVLTEATADLAFALILATARRLAEGERAVQGGGWRTWEPAGWLGADVHGATLAIVGPGRIGEAVARRAAGFDMTVLRVGRHDGLHAALAQADIVSLHAPLTDATRGLMDAAAFAACKPGAILVNTARGALVDQRALVDALRSGHLAAAGLDVTDPEPLPVDDPLLQAPNLLVVPHVGSATRSARERMAQLAVANLEAGLAAEPLPHPVSPPTTTEPTTVRPMRVSVVDIGTNSTRLFVADVTADEDVIELERRSTVTRLGQGVDADGALAPEAMDRVFTTLTSYRELIDHHDAGTHTIAVLTSAVRDASNGAEFAARVREDFRLDARTLTGDEEARLTFLGATSSRDPSAPVPVAVLDIGGGSTEIVVGERGTVAFHVSTQAGVVRQSERHIQHDPPKGDELIDTAQDVRAVFAAAVPQDVRDSVRAGVAVAGTATSCAAIVQELEPYDPARVHGYRLDRAECELILARLASMDDEERRHVPGLHPDRAPTIVPGVLMLVELMRLLDLDEVEVSEHDILRGAALSLARAR